MAGKLCPDSRRRVIALLAAVALIVAGSARLQIAVVGCGALAGLAFCRNVPAFRELPPGILQVSAGLPLWQAISGQPAAASGIAGVNAAVVGVLGAALYDPIITSSLLSPADIAIVAAGFLMLRTGRISPLLVVVWCVAARVAAGSL